MNRRRVLTFGLSAGGLVLLGRGAHAQDKYPSRPIRVIVPFPVGGGVDVAARAVGEGMREMLGQSFVIENKVGANGMIGAQAGAQAAPDGYTILMASPSEIAIAPHLYKKMQYDPFKDLAPISLCLKAPNAFVVGSSTPAKTTAELIALAKSKPGQLTCGSSGIGSIQHLQLELFNKLAGVKIVHVPYKGATPAVTDTIGGQINMTFASVIGVLPHIQNGRVRAIAVTSLERVPVLPDVPTMAETPALAGYDSSNWDGLFAPAATPKPMLKVLEDAAVRAVNSPALRKNIIDTGGIPVGDTPEQFAAFIAAESKKYAQIIKDTNVTVEN